MDDIKKPAKKEPKRKHLDFDYSKWDSLEKEMLADEEEEKNTRTREANAAVRRRTTHALYDDVS